MRNGSPVLLPIFLFVLHFRFAYCTHPLTATGEVLVGKYGAIVAYEDNPDNRIELPEGIELEKLPKQLCQHIIGTCNT